jgi:quercetin dioxygenase-like cupin family protein
MAAYSARKTDNAEETNMIPARSIFLSLAIAGACGVLSGTVGAQSDGTRPKRTELQRIDVGNTGREEVLVLTEFDPGGAEVPHTHPGEFAAYVAEGAVELSVEGRPTKVYRAGESFHVEAGKVHTGKNAFNGKTRLVVAFVVEKGKPLTTPVK